MWGEKNYEERFACFGRDVKTRNQIIQLYTMKFTNGWLFTNKLSVSDFQKSIFFICLKNCGGGGVEWEQKTRKTEFVTNFLL